MRFVMFYHSLVSDWNHGNAHFLRGYASELVERGHDVVVYEPEEGWSRRHLMAEHGREPLAEFAAAYPELRGRFYSRGALDLDRALRGADVVIVHEWNDPELVAAVGAHRERHRFRLLFHDTHHRAASDPGALGAFDLSRYDGVLAFGQVLADIYRARGWADRVFVWHEAADTRIFRPLPSASIPQLDLVWIGNWGDDERAAELAEFLLEPVRELSLRAEVWGVHYPEHAQAALATAGIRYRGWLPNFHVPRVFARARVTVHVPRRPYAEALTGIPTIRPFEAMACGIPLVSAPWRDTEHLFREGSDYRMARTGAEMVGHLRALLDHPDEACAQAEAALSTIDARHTCRHRVDQLLTIIDGFDGFDGFDGLEGRGRGRREATAA